MSRILFVDDEPRVLDGLENLLFSRMDEWDMGFVESGPEALEFMAETEVDVLVTDMRMPGMDGAELLLRTKKAHPGVVRIVLSGHAELKAAMRAMPVAHQFLSKPCEADKLIAVLSRACRLRDLLEGDAVRNVVGKVGDLPARPAVYTRVAELLADPECDLGEVAEVIGGDIGISTKLMHVVNTAFFSRGRPITSIAQAVPRLGATVVKDLVLGVEVFRNLGEGVRGFSIDTLHDHSFACAAAAAALCTDHASRDDAFMAGTLHDVGELVLAHSFADEFSEILEAAEATGRSRDELEREAMGVTHAELGAYLIGLWGMPYPVIDAVANHHTPSRSQSEEFDATWAVHVAQALVDERASGETEVGLDLEGLEGLGLTDKLPEWRERIAEVMEVER